MKKVFQVDMNQQEKLLREAGQNRTPVSLSWQDSGGWQSAKSRMIKADRSGGEIFVTYPRDLDAQALTEPGGLAVGVSFRKGHKKFAFNTLVLGRGQPGSGQQRDILALRLQYPEELCEFQRRLYNRARVPSHVTVPVDLWQGDADRTPPNHSPIHEGTMVDLSAGGMSISLPEHRNHDWSSDEPISCSFFVDASESPIRVSGYLRHQETTSDGRVRMGLQFAGLDTQPEHRETFERITHLAARLRQM
jgi:c-di-GMP-binding flagellar brake protein YcgR